MIRYLLLYGKKTEYRREENSYGIRVVRGHRTLRVIRDITDNRELLSSLIDDLNELALDPVHLDAVLEDFLSY